MDRATVEVLKAHRFPNFVDPNVEVHCADCKVELRRESFVGDDGYVRMRLLPPVPAKTCESA